MSSIQGTTPVTFHPIISLPNYYIRLENFTGLSIRGNPPSLYNYHYCETIDLMGPAFFMPLSLSSMPMMMHNDNAEESAQSSSAKNTVGRRQTTVIIKNVPYSYGRETLAEHVDQFCRAQNCVGKPTSETISAFNLIYLPIRIPSNLNKGYGFVNFTTHEAASKFIMAWNGTQWNDSSITRWVEYSKVQGPEAIEALYKSGEFSTQRKDEFMAVFYHPARDGTSKAVEERTVGGVSKPQKR